MSLTATSRLGPYEVIAPLRSRSEDHLGAEPSQYLHTLRCGRSGEPGSERCFRLHASLSRAGVSRRRNAGGTPRERRVTVTGGASHRPRHHQRARSRSPSRHRPSRSETGKLRGGGRRFPASWRRTIRLFGGIDTHYFKRAGQLTTSVIGAGLASRTDRFTRNRPSEQTS